MNSDRKELISVVIPVYGCNATLNELVLKIDNVFSNLYFQYEIILVDDYSEKETWLTILKICEEYPTVKGIKLSRNFGQHYAITCGLKHAKGEWIVVMDCDLQDQPEEIKNLIEKSQLGYDIVVAKRALRQDSYKKRIGSFIFYKLLSYLTNTKQDYRIANFGIYHSKVISAVLSMGDQIRYFPTMVQWVGFNKTSIDVVHSKRQEGKSSYNFRTLISLAFNNIVAFSDKPLRLTIKLGFTISFLAFLVGIYYLTLYFKGEIIQIGYTSIVLSIWFLAGVIISILGIIGFYVGKTFEKVKSRPYYIIEETRNT